MNILSVNGDFQTILLVNYRNLYCFISLIQLLQRKFINNAKNRGNYFCDWMFEPVKCCWPKLHPFLKEYTKNIDSEAECPKVEEYVRNMPEA